MKAFKTKGILCFNPCFIGTYSFTYDEKKIKHAMKRFNPCFIGTYSFTQYPFFLFASTDVVLILVLLELILLQQNNFAITFDYLKF